MAKATVYLRPPETRKIYQIPAENIREQRVVVFPTKNK
jgi:hypothetical protein